MAIRRFMYRLPAMLAYLHQCYMKKTSFLNGFSGRSALYFRLLCGGKVSLLQQHAAFPIIETLTGRLLPLPCNIIIINAKTA